MDIAVIGAGYVGLVSGACFAELGHNVTCVDIDPDKVALLKAGISPIYEPGIEDMIRACASAGRLGFTTDLVAAAAGADAVFIAVGTPPGPDDGHADLSHVLAAVRSTAGAVRRDATIVVKSTVPVGVGDEIERIVQQIAPDVSVVSNPEFLREGVAIGDFMRPDRVIIGTEDPAAREIMRRIYDPLGPAVPLLFVSRRTSEMIKYAANCFLSMKISFINEIADLCEVAGADVGEVAVGIGLDTRIGSNFLNAGPGYGGSCFPKDTVALARTARELDVPLQLVEATIRVNDERKKAMAGKIIAAAGGDLRGKRVAILGLTFKPGTDDMREAPSIDIVRGLQHHGATISACDPEGEKQASAILSGVTYCKTPYEAADGASALVIVTEWDHFRGLDFARLGAAMEQRILVDLRNVYRENEVVPFGFAYSGVGRPVLRQADGAPVRARQQRARACLPVR